MWQVPGHSGRVGFISSMTKNFCSTCNRLRLTADGNLKVRSDRVSYGNGPSSADEHVFVGKPRKRRESDSQPQVCLFGAAEVSLRDALRDGATVDQLEDLIRVALRNKKPQHAGTLFRLTVFFNTRTVRITLRRLLSSAARLPAAGSARRGSLSCVNCYIY